MRKEGYAIGMIGLGVMGRNLALNMAEHGFAVVGYDRDAFKTAALSREAGTLDARPAEDLKELIALLRRPRAVMLMVPAGAPVDGVLQELLPLLECGDLVIDGGNSHYTDTNLRARMLAEQEVDLLGMGISGGEQGARHGPSMMPGGPRQAWDRVRPLFEAIAARVDGDPCVTWIGEGAAGHYVKMVHNGIEYGLMELLAEAYALLRRELRLDDGQIHDTFERWSQGDLHSYLVEITVQIFSQVDEKTGRRLIDVILDEAKQKGTGKWASQDAMDLQLPIPTIDAAVAMRDLSVYRDERRMAEEIYGGELDAASRVALTHPKASTHHLERALYAAFLITYAQGFALLRKASLAYGYGLDLAVIACIWRGGCIIRAALLEDIRAAYRLQPDLPNLLLAPDIVPRITDRIIDFRLVVQLAVGAAIPIPALTASLGYLDGYRSGWLPANLIQAQRDFFGAHTYERLDTRGTFHTHWSAAEGVE